VTFDAYSIALHVLVCKTCGTKASDTDAERLSDWQREHERSCP
jgi:hypothetical protein